MCAFGGVLQNLPRLGIDADLIGRLAVFDVERITQAATALFLFELLIGDRAGPGFERQHLVAGPRQ